MSDNDFDDVNCDEYEYESFLDNEYNQDAPDAPQDPVISEEDDNSEKENLSQSRRISPAWNYFNDRTSQYPGRPVCCRCQKVFGKDTGISTLKRHLSSAHKITIENVKHTLKTQSVLNFKRIDPWPEKEKSERDNAVVEWIIGDAQPFRTVENLQFRQMVNTFDSRYQVPDKNGIKNLVIDYFEAKRDNIQYDLNNIPGKISLTTDIWTSTFNNDAYLGLTIHFIDNDWNLRNFLLDIMSFTTRHTGGNIADAIISTLKEFHIFEKTLALTSDNESAMVVCGRIIAAELAYELDNQSFRHYRCSAHILNLAAQQGIKIIDNEIGKIRELMKKIKNSLQKCNRLRELCLIENLQYYKPQIDVETRWNSTYI
ncbi:zinc finger BED domain-containing protein RICESLEEPER 2-like [Rhizophagus clarus]|uniref:Zinc finger BED domain-containing protein RICESLEEPER 2-like n=1 Tax=Rhizophagus clarus TaxID=94130 RepID=A0A8H3MDZ6_9GLOM|nr:zinc finger BED domain-containing protein RICESLEEPER 2-like [Rhizophagus clarus]